MPIDIVVFSPHPSCRYSHGRVRRLRNILSLREAGIIGVKGDGGRSLVHGKEVFHLAESTLSGGFAVCHYCCGELCSISMQGPGKVYGTARPIERARTDERDKNDVGPH